MMSGLAATQAFSLLPAEADPDLAGRAEPIRAIRTAYLFSGYLIAHEKPWIIGYPHALECSSAVMIRGRPGRCPVWRSSRAALGREFRPPIIGF
jgi:hypothetical protein